MVSCKLYDKIREELLPYNYQLVIYAMKIISISVFAYFLFQISHLVKPVDISPSIKLLLTLGAAAVPYIWNVLEEHKSNEEVKAHNDVQIKMIERILLEIKVRPESNERESI